MRGGVQATSASLALLFVASSCGFNSDGKGLEEADTIGSSGSSTTAAGATEPTESTASTTMASTTSPESTDATTNTDDGSTGDQDGTTGALGCGGAEAWALSGWARRMPLTIDNAAVIGDLTDVPILVRLDQEDLNYSGVAENGNDLRFVASSTGEVLAHEVERWSSDDTSWLWFKLPSLPAAPSAPTPVWLYYDNPNVDNGTQEAAVWTDNFESVHHFQDRSDSTGHGHNAITSNGPGNARGQMGRAASFDGGNDYLELPPEEAFDFTTAVTVEAWIRADGWNARWVGIVTKGSNTWRLQRDDNNAFLSWDLNGDGSASNVNGAVNVADNQWHYLVAVYGGNNHAVYVDGVLDGMQVFDGPILPNDNSVRIGDNSGASAREFQGRIDEVRISSAARAPDWIAYQNRVMRDQVITFGSEQTCFE